MESVVKANDWILTATILSALLTGILIFIKAGKQKRDFKNLLEALQSSRRQAKALEKTAEEIRKELLEIQQRQDISQIKMQSNQSSTQELQNALTEAQNRLKIAETALKERKTAEIALREMGKATATKLPSTGTSVEADIDLEPVAPFAIEVETTIGLSEEQQEQLIGLLDPGPKGNVDIFCIVDDENSETTAKQLESILAADGWKTNGVAKSAFTKPPRGVVLAVNSKDTAPSYASFLQRVFSTIGMMVSPKVDKKYREWSLTIIVGISEN